MYSQLETYNSPSPRAFSQTPCSLHYLRVPNGGNFQGELRAFVLLSEDQGSHHSSFGPLDLWLMVREGDIELLD